jgi:hypothetical protein
MIGAPPFFLSALDQAGDRSQEPFDNSTLCSAQDVTSRRQTRQRKASLSIGDRRFGDLAVLGPRGDDRVA